MESEKVKETVAVGHVRPEAEEDVKEPVGHVRPEADEEVKETVGHIRPEAEEEEAKTIEEAKARLSSSSSSSSSCASSSTSSSPRTSFERDVTESSPPTDDSIPKSKSEGDLSQRRKSPSESLERSLSSNASPQTTSPPVQKMEQPSKYDPNRIPASIFGSKPANVSEWSVASNDSLFSIHVGNNSFAKDQFRLDESSSLYVPEAKSSELCSLPPLMEVPPHEESSSVKSSSVSTLEKEEMAMKAASSPRPSHESTASSAFPAAEGEGGMNSPSEQVEEQKQEEQTQDPGEKSRYFSWCPCLPRCC